MYNLLIVINSGLILYCCGWFTSFTFFLVWPVFSGGWLQRLITASEDSVDPAKTQDKVPCTYWQPWITGSWELSLTNSRFFCLYRYSKQSNELFRKKFRNCKYKLNNYQLIAKKVINRLIQTYWPIMGHHCGIICRDPQTMALEAGEISISLILNGIIQLPSFN